MVTSVFTVYLLGMTITEDVPFALYELKKVVFWVVLPLAFYISPTLIPKRFYNVLIVFGLAVFTATIVAIIRILFKEYFQINGFRDITLISHIRFSFQVLLSIIIATYFLISGSKIFSFKHSNILLLIFMIWMVGFLIILKSITGIIAFIGTAVVLLFLFIIRIQNKRIMVAVIFFLVFIISAPVFYVAKVWKDFYNTEEVNTEEVDKFTASGNPYYFDFSSQEKENGNWVRLYLCERELRNEWNKKSRMKYDSLDAKGYSYSSTLIRYLTSKGLRKDSIGINSLTKDDIRAIENGIANYIYWDKGISIYPRIYETIWEIDRYRTTGDPNYQSFSQRIEFVKASLLLIKKNPWFGIGTGNWKIKYAEIYDEMNSKLIRENQGPSHNQYLNYMVKFGIIGFIYIFSVLLIPVFRENHRYNLLFWLFIVAIGIVNFGDSNLETHMGLSFICFFYCLFLWHTPEKIKTFRL